MKIKTKLKHKTLSQVKKKCWTTFSLYIRMRDCLKTTGDVKYGKCITCQRMVAFNKADAGHFISRQFASTLFDEKNVHLQCKQCNAFGGKPLEYRRQIIKLYGEGYDVILEDKATEIKKYTVPELEELTKYYEEQIKILEGK